VTKEIAFKGIPKAKLDENGKQLLSQVSAKEFY
jgi:hypothetical protein